EAHALGEVDGVPGQVEDHARVHPPSGGDRARGGLVVRRCPRAAVRSVGACVVAHARSCGAFPVVVRGGIRGGASSGSGGGTSNRRVAFCSSTAAPTSPANSGCARVGRDLSSGWACVPT